MIEVEGLTHTYPGSAKPAIDRLSFGVDEGEVFGFLGPSGAGKSTTQNVLIGLLEGWRGSVRVMGRSVREWGGALYQSIGVSFELPNHYLKLTARENLEYFRALYGDNTDKTEDVLALVGLEADIDKKVEAFSKGMMNRLNFARSLLNKPRLWFLDEPTAGLDPVNAVRIRNVIKQRQAEGVTCLVTTHDMHTADDVCDRVAFIIDGKIATIDAPEALRRRYGRRAVQVCWGDEADETVRGRAEFPLDGLADNAAFLDTLRRDDLLSLHSQEASLEQVFVEVTGRTLT
jgi:fluoroquinolone transport system ATP-binding protein